MPGRASGPLQRVRGQIVSPHLHPSDHGIPASPRRDDRDYGHLQFRGSGPSHQQRSNRAADDRRHVEERTQGRHRVISAGCPGSGPPSQSTRREHNRWEPVPCRAPTLVVFQASDHPPQMPPVDRERNQENRRCDLRLIATRRPKAASSCGIPTDRRAFL